MFFIFKDYFLSFTFFRVKLFGQGYSTNNFKVHTPGTSTVPFVIVCRATSCPKAIRDVFIAARRSAMYGGYYVYKFQCFHFFIGQKCFKTVFNSSILILYSFIASACFNATLSSLAVLLIFITYFLQITMVCLLVFSLVSY